MKKIFILFSILSTTIIAPEISFAYDPETTHAGLTEQVVEFYNLYNKDAKISTSDKELIIQGSIDEDEPEKRALNHFYDPMRNGMGFNNYRSAASWATESNNTNEFTWDKSIKKYAEGDKEGALIGLGHILHLAEDMTVPDHTRNDGHKGDNLADFYTGSSFYEVWARENKNRQTMRGVALDYYGQGLRPRSASNIESTFRNIASYSNNNYVSPDTIDNGIYLFPKVISRSDGYAYGDDTFRFDRHKLYIEFSLRNGDIVRSLFNNEDFSVLEEYFSRLSRMAILSGAGIVQLFISEGEYAREEYLKVEQKKLADIAKAEEEKNRKLTEGDKFSQLWYKVSYAVTDTTRSLANSISGAVSNTVSKISHSSSVAVNTAGYVTGFLGYTGNTLTAMGAEKVKQGAIATTKAVVSSSKNVTLYINDTGSNLRNSVAPGINNSLQTQRDQSQTGLSSSDISLLISILESSADTSANTANEDSSQNKVSHHSSSANNQEEPVVLIATSTAVTTATSTEDIATSTATTTDDTIVEDVAASTEEMATTTATSTDAIEEEEITTATTTFYTKVPTPTILSFEDIDETEPTTTIYFYGTSTPGFTVSYINLSNSETASTITDEWGDWEFDIEDVNLSSTTIDFYAESDELNLSTTTFDSELATTTTTYYVKSDPARITFYINTTVPNVVFNTPEECSNSISSDICLLIASTASIINFSWVSTSTDVAYYNISVEDRWEDEVISATTTGDSLLISFETNNDYTVSLSETDSLGNISGTTVFDIALYVRPVVINEVGWMGTEASREDEWIEIANTTEHVVNLDNWSLTSLSGSIDIDLDGEIEAEGYFLLERTDDNVVSDIIADLIYGTDDSSFDLDDDGDVLMLFFGEEEVDRTPTDITEGWAAGRPYEEEDCNLRSMERRNVWNGGEEKRMWGNNDYGIQNGIDFLGNIMISTPRQKNSLQYPILI